MICVAAFILTFAEEASVRDLCRCSYPQNCQERVSYKSVQKDRRTRVSSKKCQERVSSKSVTQEVSCKSVKSDMSYKSVKQECEARVSDRALRNSVTQGCPIRVSSQCFKSGRAQ